VEFLYRHQARKQSLHKHQFYPENGNLTLPDLPGLGLVLDEDRVTREDMTV